MLLHTNKENEKMSDIEYIFYLNKLIAKLRNVQNRSYKFIARLHFFVKYGSKCVHHAMPSNVFK